MNDNVVPTAIHRITTVHAGARRLQRARADCPRAQCSVDLAVCSGCPHARGLVPSGDDAPRSLLCAVDRSERVQAEPGSVGSVMRRDVVCVSPRVEIDDIVLLFVEKDIGGVPVVDDDDKPVGMISKTDLLATYAREHVQRGELLDSFDADFAALAFPVCARDVMSGVVFTLRENESLARAAELFASERVHRAPVVGTDGKVVGVLTAFDVVRAVAGRG